MTKHKTRHGYTPPQEDTKNTQITPYTPEPAESDSTPPEINNPRYQEKQIQIAF